MSNFSKFKRGDMVKNTADRPGKVLNTYKQDGEFMIHVQMDSGFRTDYLESDLKFYHKDIEHNKKIAPEHIGDKCPKCNTPWTKTRFGTRNWKDCLPCGKTAEDLLDKNTREEISFDDSGGWDDLMADWGTD